MEKEKVCVKVSQFRARFTLHHLGVKKWCHFFLTKFTKDSEKFALNDMNIVVFSADIIAYVFVGVSLSYANLSTYLN